MNEKEFKDRLIAAREELGLSQSELARRVDMKPTQLARYEGGALPLDGR
ncbi:helix-turn-helix transcriptional regulator [Delftia sp.]|nr:helix-turn-helix transcriptional regulator [Delftia sp.]